ncbi:trypsin-like peptidase domain-containing protein [Streptomyces sp. NPDC005423]|uniref:S1C family serine protease n=1 Tax=Streptomyces sp. NPDC005423 TaxID=3155343 RepID=UPI0033AC0073
MNEGTPEAGPKWWNRGRSPSAEVPPGEKRVPVVVAGDTDGNGTGDDDGRAGGDFRLPPPAARGAGGEAIDDPASGDAGDFELPAPTRQLSHDDGDYELDRPAPDVTQGPAPASDTAASLTSAPTPAPTSATVSASAETNTPPAADPPHPSPAAEPLHDPDPYSTPPYGHPGPWASAPPVQHPATRPTHEPTHEPAPTAPSAPPEAPTPPPLAATPAQEPTPTTPGTPATPTSPPPWHRYDPWSGTPFAGANQRAGGFEGGAGRRRAWAGRRLVGAALAVAVVCGGVGGLVGALVERSGRPADVVLPQAGREADGRAPDSIAGIAARALPSVVTLHVSGADESGTGTGIVLDARGHILTNEHVVEPAGPNGRISVRFSGGRTVDGAVVGHDTGYDLAVVKVSGVRGLRPMPLGNSDNVRVGDPVVAIGAPFDLDNTVTAGIISAKERPVTTGGGRSGGGEVSYVDALQTDAPINPGNSGGPLLDARGRLVGVNSAIRSADGGSGGSPGDGRAGSIGLGFAIPVNQAKRVAEELINTGRAAHPVIGVTLDMGYSGDGARVGTNGGAAAPPVTPGGPGDRAGIKAGDVVTEADGRPVHTGQELIVRTRAHRPGDRLTLILRRDGRERTVTLVLGSSADG